MAETSLAIWLAWFLFAVSLVYVVARKYLPAALAVRDGAARFLEDGAGPATAPWLFCEDGTALDKRARWFRISPQGATVVGNRPQNARGDTAYVYLTAHDLKERQLVIRYDRSLRRYVLERGEGRLLHNNEPVADGQVPVLTDGDTLEVGSITRLRFTFSGPPEAVK